MRTIFWGTPQVAVPFLEHLFSRTEVQGVVTQTDKPSQRGQKTRESPVKVFAETHGIPIFQPSSLKDEKFISEISGLKAEAGIVVAYGRILPRQVIESFLQGIFNIHFSLLPILRGASPIQHAILAGHSKTGVTSFRIAESLDTGHIVVQKEISISSEDTAITLEQNLVPLGLEALEETLKIIESGQSQGKPQSGTSSYAPLIRKEDARIHWDRTAKEIDCQVRALIRLGTFCQLQDGKVLKILEAHPHPNPHSGHPLQRPSQWGTTPWFPLPLYHRPLRSLGDVPD